MKSASGSLFASSALIASTVWLSSLVTVVFPSLVRSDLTRDEEGSFDADCQPSQGVERLRVSAAVQVVLLAVSQRLVIVGDHAGSMSKPGSLVRLVRLVPSASIT